MITQVISTLRKLYQELEHVIGGVRSDGTVLCMYEDVACVNKLKEELH